MTVREYMIKVALATAADNRYGYNNNYPNNRFGQGSDPYNGDCGAFVSYCLNKALASAGISEDGYFEPVGYNGGPADIANEAYLTTYCDRYAYNSIKTSLQAGDILLAGGHTALMTGSNQITHAGGDHDGRSGDSGGNEVCTTGWFNSGWVYVYRLKKKYGGKASSGKSGRTKKFKERTKSPEGEFNPCYMTWGSGAIDDKRWNTSIAGSPTISGANVLCNCVGYAQGRALEIYCELEGYNPGKTGSHPFSSFNCNAGEFVSRAPDAGMTVSKDPGPGAIMCWTQAGNAGHVAVVEKVIDKNTIQVSESGWGGGIGGKPWVTHKRYRGSGNWDGDLFTMGSYSFQGFILNPAKGSAGGPVEKEYVLDTRPLTEAELREYIKKYSGYKGVVSYEEVSVTKTFEGLQTASEDIKRVNANKLLSYPSLVESPFVILKVGDYSFGTYIKNGDLNKISNVNYPNYITGMQVQKVNGTVNQYTINLTYQIEAGNDPNLIDKILSKVGYGLVYISYGDWSCPTFIYKEEEAIIVNVKSNVEFSNSRINYTITCTSNSIALAASTFNYAARKAKPSDIIWEMLYNNQYGLLDFFPGMKNATTVRNKGLIATNDIVVDIPSKESMDPVSYLNYLVTCMTSNTSGDSILKDSVYYLTIYDDTRGELGGPYFKITEVKSQGKTLATADTYEVDVGFPTDNLVTDFSIKDDNSWALLYNYASNVDIQNYVYSLDDKGNIVTRYSPNITTSAAEFKTTEAQKTWWTNMTKFPINAELTIKGLLRPSMLMTYVRINAFFYGQRHISSGLYIITQQIDNISSRGYNTRLSLVRIGGDEDYITQVTKTVTTKSPIITLEKGEGYAKILAALHKEFKLIPESGNGEGSTVHFSSSGTMHGGGGLGTF